MNISTQKENFYFKITVLRKMTGVLIKYLKKNIFTVSKIYHELLILMT